MQSHCTLFSHKDSEASIRPRIRLVRWDPTLPTGQLNWDSNLKPHFVTLALYQLSHLIPWHSLNSATCYPDTLWTQLPVTLTLFELSYLLPWQSLNSVTFYPDTLWTQLPFTLALFELSYLLPWHSLKSVTFYPDTVWTQSPVTLTLFELSYLSPGHSVSFDSPWEMPGCQCDGCVSWTVTTRDRQAGVVSPDAEHHQVTSLDCHRGR